MIRRRTKDSQCSRKTRFKSRPAAESEMRRINDRLMQVYECPWCDGFHLGHGRFRKPKVSFAEAAMNKPLDTSVS